MPESMPAIIDIEASGFGRGSYPIEVGTVLSDGTPHCYLVRPEPEWTHWDESAEQVHGIARKLIEQRGLPVDEIARRLNALLGNATVYSDGWGVDRAWLALLFEHAGMAQHFTLESVRNLLNEQQTEYWHPTYARVVAELNLSRHRASSDAMIIQHTLGRVRAHHA